MRGKERGSSLNQSSFVAEVLRLNVSIQCAPPHPAPFQVPAFSAAHKILRAAQRSEKNYYKIIPTVAKLLLAFYLLIVESCYTYSCNKLVYDLHSMFSSLKNGVSVEEKNENETLSGLEALAEPIFGNGINTYTLCGLNITQAHVNYSSNIYKLENVRRYCLKFLSPFVQEFSHLVLRIFSHLVLEFFCQLEGNSFSANLKDTSQIMGETALADIYIYIRHALANT